MLVVPFIFGMVSGGARLMHILLFAVWLLTYLFSYPVLQAIRTRKWKVYRTPMLLYGGLLLASGVALAWLEPGLIVWVVPFLPLFAINCAFARANNERSFVNDLVAVVQFSLIVFVSHELGGRGEWAAAARLFALNLLYFTGTIFYVKTMIREKHNKAFYRYSVIYHVLLLIAGILLYPPVICAPLAVLLVRAVLMPRRSMTVKQIGILEFIYSLLMVYAVIWTYG
jgi:hypothetical protein